MRRMLRHSVPDRTMSNRGRNMLHCYMDSGSSMSFFPVLCGNISRFLPAGHGGTIAYHKQCSDGYLLHHVSGLPDNNHPADRLHDDTVQCEVLSDTVLRRSGSHVGLLLLLQAQGSSRSSLPVG